MRLLTLRSCVTGLVVVSLAGFAAAQQTPAEKTAEQVFKNIQVFKGKPANELIPTMEFIAGSLGVHCSFCHEEDRSLDTKPAKKRAREMVEMVYAINKSTFGGDNEVNCYTCHRGSPHPDGRLALASLTGSAAPQQAERPSRPKDLPSAQAIFSKYVDAIGGTGALAAVRGETVTAERVAEGKSSPVEITRADGKLYLSAGGAKSGYDGAAFWSAGRRGVNRSPSSSTVTQLRTDLALYPAAGLDAAKARVFGEQSINGQPAYLVGVRTASGFDTYAFGKQTGLLLRYTTGAPTFLGALPLQVDYSDYRAVGGVKLPFALTFDTHEGHWERKISKIELNPSVSASQFAAPAAK